MTRNIRILYVLTALLFLTTAVVCHGASKKQFTVIIDAGHGGHDTGAKGSSTLEKDINLGVAKRLGRLLTDRMDDVRIVYTRDSDTFITLQGRCDVANKAKGDIFVSIHTNSVDAKSPNRNTVNGASVYTLGLEKAEKNLDVAMRENSVMKLEDDYTANYCGFDPGAAESYIMFEMTQNHHLSRSVSLADAIQRELITTGGRRDMGVRQGPFWVLVRTSMPAVLVELDFVCNPDVEDFLASDKGRDRLARAICNGIENYRKHTHVTDKGISDSVKEKPGGKKKKEKNVTTPKNKSGVTVYKVQFLTSPKRLSERDKRLRDIDGLDSYIDGQTVKYTSGSFDTLREAQKRLRELKKRYPDSFIITMRDGHRVN